MSLTAWNAALQSGPNADVDSRPALTITLAATAGGALIGALFLLILLASLKVPRFFCRFLCPLGALLGVLSRTAVYRIGKLKHPCADCGLCNRDCEGACDPGGEIRTSECLMCMNCLEGCFVERVMTFGPAPLAGEQTDSTGLTRRGFLVSAGAGLLSAPLIRLNGRGGANWDPRLIRPPGSREENEFLKRCIKCGQCIRVCPTNVSQPAGLDTGAEALWTPRLNMRIGTSGCQLNCVACGNVCPTSAIRPLSLDEKLGRGEFRDSGPVRMGTAFVDRSRCLPWALDRPCIVCEENCPLTPKAIDVVEMYREVPAGARAVLNVSADAVIVSGPPLTPDRFGTGDYYLAPAGSRDRRRILSNTADRIDLERANRVGGGKPVSRGAKVEILVRLQGPRVDPARCVGCGVCEHECPVNGLRAIRVSAENESRSDEHLLTVRNAS